jgi:hypothetical protein
MDYQPDDATIGRFCAMTGAESGHAQFLLEASNGNFESAVGMFYGGLPCGGQQRVARQQRVQGALRWAAFCCWLCLACLCGGQRPPAARPSTPSGRLLRRLPLLATH